MAKEFKVDPAIKAKAEAELAVEVTRLNKAREEALHLLDLEASNTIKSLINHRNSSDESVSLNAAKYLAKIQGFEIERHVHSGEIQITYEQAQSVLEEADD